MEYLYRYVANILCINFSNPFSNCVWNNGNDMFANANVSFYLCYENPFFDGKTHIIFISQMYVCVYVSSSKEYKKDDSFIKNINAEKFRFQCYIMYVYVKYSPFVLSYITDISQIRMCIHEN